MAHQGHLQVVCTLGIVTLWQSSAAADINTIDYDVYTEPNRALHYRLERADPQLDAKGGSENHDQENTADVAMRHGLLSPFTLSPVILTRSAVARATAGYDSAAQAFRARSMAEASVTQFLALRVDFEHGPSTGAGDRVGLGARIQLLKQAAHGIDGGLFAAYQPNDFRREGNIAAGILLGRHFGSLSVFGSAVVGSDPEGDDREFDARFAILMLLERNLSIGWDNRFRAVESSDEKRVGTTSTDWELASLPTATVTAGPIAFVSELGLSALQTTSSYGQVTQHRDVAIGMLALAGAGAAF